MSKSEFPNRAVSQTLRAASTKHEPLAERALLEAFRAMDDDSREFVLIGAEALAQSYPRQRRLTLVSNARSDKPRMENFSK